MGRGAYERHFLHARYSLVACDGLCGRLHAGARHQRAGDPSWQEEFATSDCTLVTTGRNRYFVLEPGYRIVLAGTTALGAAEELAITVLDETRVVDGVETRVVEEREWRDGQLIEVSRNFFALCEATGDVFYFGEEVDMVENGQAMALHTGQSCCRETQDGAALDDRGASPRIGLWISAWQTSCQTT